MGFPNLTSHENSDEIIKKELTTAGIRLVHHDQPLPGDVRCRTSGKIGDIEFRRAWNHWYGEGPVIITAAMEIYSTPIGKRDVWAGGYDSCLPPYLCATGGFVWKYKIRSQEGLNWFVDVLKKFGLA
ncbi:hypothetical protein KJ605_01930 [Patescibacteria group bacterium]|nr:hypothetical protein [Patescibacteria group bacterium]MBU1970513.1 hypothetical protein [Patescibacteria group bacterium]